MAESDIHLQILQRSSLTADFIHSHMPVYREAIRKSSLEYNPAFEPYIFMRQPNTMPLDSPPFMSSAPSDLIPPRPLPSAISAMIFWKDIFPDAMAEFKAQHVETPGRVNSQYNIRDGNDWEEVYDRLEMAQESYTKATGIIGWVRKVRRKAADNIQPLIEASKFVPDVDYVTPVLGAVKVLLEVSSDSTDIVLFARFRANRAKAVRNAAKKRQTILEGFDNVDEIFADVELFLGTFPEDENIKVASIGLVVTTFTAIEQAIEFFTKHLGKLSHTGRIPMHLAERTDSAPPMFHSCC
jgi:hypothetical protein